MSISAGVGSSVCEDAQEAVNQAYKEAKDKLAGAKISFILLFSTLEYASVHVLDTLRRLSANAPVLGSSSSYLINGSSIIPKGLIIILLSMDKNSFSISCVRDITQNNRTEAGETMAEKLLSGMGNKERKCCLIFADGTINLYSHFLKGMREKLGLSFPLIGATSWSVHGTKKTYQYFNGELLSGGAVAILLGGSVDFGLGFQHGYKPLGKPREITLAHENIIFEIDRLPAIKIYEDYFGEKFNGLSADFRRISALYPIGISIPGETGYLLRNITSFRENGTIVCQDEVPKGSTMRLMISTRESCLEAAQTAAREAASGLTKYRSLRTDSRIKIGMMFKGAGIGSDINRLAEEELKAARDTFPPEAPLIGFYSLSEQAPLKSTNYYLTWSHNYSNMILALKG